MILVDTSVWIDHFRKSNARLQSFLMKGGVVCHQLIIGELVCGNFQNRKEIISLLQALPKVSQISFDDSHMNTKSPTHGLFLLHKENKGVS